MTKLAANVTATHRVLGLRHDRMVRSVGHTV